MRQVAEQTGDAGSLADAAWPEVKTRLGAYVRRRVAPAAADDVVGDILLRLVRHRDALTAAANPSAWMLRVAANAVADHHRRRAVEQRALAEAAAEDEATGATTATDGASDASPARELARCLIPMIEALPESYAEALMLIEIEGLTQAAAARRVGLSLSGMKSRVQRGRAKLKQALLRCCAVQLDGRGGVMDYRSKRR